MMGTHPHEWFMFHGAMYGYKQANYMALENWVNVYDGDLGIALSDTYTSEVFMKNLSRKQAKLFDGVRCDSGDEFKFINSMIARYKELGVDPTTKTIVFSNALDFDKCQDIMEYCGSRFIPFENFRKSYDSAGQIMHPHDEMAESDCWSQLCARHGEDVVNKVWSRHLASEFKRKKAPIYISRELYE